MRIGILGIGSIGVRHLSNLLALGYDDITVYDTDLDRCGVAPGVPVRWITALSLAGFWAAKPEVVLICTPPGSHFDLAVEAVRQGCHIFIEKPLGTSLAGWPQLAEQCAKAELVNMVGCNWRYAPRIAKLKQAIDLHIIRPTSIYLCHESDLRKWRRGGDWKASYSASKEQGGVLRESAYHLVDLALWMGGELEIVGGCTIDESPKLPGVDSRALLSLCHKNGPNSVIEADFLHTKYRMCVTVEDDDDNRLGWDWDGAGWNTNQMYREELRAFLHAVEFDDMPNPNPIEQAIKVQEIIVEAKQWEQQRL